MFNENDDGHLTPETTTVDDGGDEGWRRRVLLVMGRIKSLRGKRRDV